MSDTTVGWLVVIGMLVLFSAEIAYFVHDSRKTRRRWAADNLRYDQMDEERRLKDERTALLRGRTTPCAFCGRTGQALGYDNLCQDVTTCLAEGRQRTA